MESIGGYRIVRRLGAGPRAEVFLGHSDSSGATPGGTAAIKLFRPGVSRHGIDQEIEVLTRGRSRHLLRLDDVATTQDGRQCLVVPRLGTSLTRLLVERSTLAPGEAVTILAPIARAIAELHDAGCCHGAVAPGTVFFDDSGAPVLARFGHACTFAGGLSGAEPEEGRMPPASQAARSAEPRVADDLRQLRALGGVLFGRSSPGRSSPGLASPGHGSRAVDAFLDWLDASERETESARFANDLCERLFDLAEPLPIGLPGVLSSRPSDVRAVVPRARALPRPAAITSESVRQRPRWLRSGETVRTVGSRLRSMWGRVAAVLSTVRRSFLVAGGAGLIALLAAAVLLPSAGADSTEPSSGTLPVPAPSPTQSARSSAIRADDPVAAIRPLLHVRDTCIAARSIACLDGADQRGSSSWENDSHLIRSLQEGAGPAGDASLASLADETFVLTERLGDSALLTTKTVTDDTAQSVLVMKGESGWRIRDFLPR